VWRDGVFVEKLLGEGEDPAGGFAKNIDVGKQCIVNVASFQGADDAAQLGHFGLDLLLLLEGWSVGLDRR